MPLANRTVLPSWLGRRSISEEDSTEENSLTAVSHNAVLGTIIQLASLVRHADDIFCDLAEECQLVFEKAESITHRIEALDKTVKQLDSTEVNIPLGTLEQFAAVDDHHVARHGFDCDHFTPERRPHCVQFSYSRCDTTPVHALRGTDLYRKDGQSGPFLFKLWPIALRDVATPLEAGGEDMAPARSFPALAVHRRKKPTKVRQRPKTIHGIDAAMLQEAQALADSGGAADGKLDHSLSKSQPSVLVSVDTSGAGFERMASFRQSQRGLHGDDTLDRKRRRRTVSGVPNNIMQEIEQFEQDRRIDRGTRRKYSLDDLDPVDLDARDKMMQQYLVEIDAAREEREEEAYAEQREGKLLKFLPCRRSRSLPRCVQLMATSPVERGDGGSIRRSKRASKSPLLSLSRLSLYTKRGQSNSSQRCRDDEEGDEIRLEPRQTSAILADSRRFSSSASLGSSASGAGRTARSLLRRGSRSGSLKRQSVIGEKLRSLVTNTLLRPRPKSLDLDAIELEEDKISPSRIAASSPSVVVCGTGKEGSKRRRSRKDNSGERSSSLSRLGSSSATKENSSSSVASVEPSRAGSSRDVHVGPGSYYYFDSNHTLPRAQARKYDFPWDSLPKDWTTSVKLREISKRRKEDRQSSSGNWSQSNFSSNRQSLESEAAKYSSVGHSESSSRLSQHSQGRDSGRGSPRYLHKSGHELDQGYMGDAASTESVVSSSSTAADESSTVAEGSSCNGDDWLRALAERAASRGDVTSTSAEALAQLSRVTRQNIQNLDLLVPGRKHKRRSLPPQDLDNESIYSVDQEGFYTSFHTDSGLKRSSTELLDMEGEDERQESLSHCGFDDDLMLPPREIRGSKSLQSMSSSSTMGSIMVRPQVDKDLGWSSTSVSSPDLVSLSRNKKTSQVGDSRLEDQGEVSESSTAGHSGSDLSCEFDDKIDCIDTGTIKPREKKKKLGPPPPPPPRSSSISSSSTNNKTRDPLNLSDRKFNSNDSKDSSANNTPSLQAVNTSPQCPQAAASSSSPDEGSDHETIYARLKLKTSISVHTFPSWCAGLVSDDEDLASLKANPLSASHERLHAEASEVQEMFTKGHVNSLLHHNSKASPSPFSTTAVVLDDLDFPANSWPRGKRLTSAGILKTPEKEKITKGSNHGHSKTLNFDPVVNLFDAQTPHSVQMPLSYLSSSDESGSSPPSGEVGSKPRPGTIPFSSTHNRRYHGSSGTSSKDMPFASSTPTSGRNQILGRAYRENKQKQVGSQNYSNNDGRTSVSSNAHNSTTGSNFTGSCASITSISSINSLEAADAGHMSSLTGSCSTIALSDIDSSSLTRVSLNEGDGNCSISSASSSLSLNWDTDGTPNPTPIATPARTRVPLNNQKSTAKPDTLKVTHCGQKDALLSSDRVFSENYSPGPNSTLRDQGLPAHTNQSKSTPLSQLPVLPDSCPSSATPTPTLTPNPANIPPMQPIEANYLPDSTGLKSKDKNNNKAAFFNFPDSTKIESGDIPLNIPHSQQNTQANQNSKSFKVFTNLSTVSSITASPLPSSNSNRRRSSPAVSHKGYIPQGQVCTTDSEGESRDNLQGQRGRRQSGGSLAERSVGSSLGSIQPKMAVQPFLQTPSSTAAAAVTHAAHSSKPSIVTSQHQPSSKSAPLIKPQLLREVRTDNTKFPVKQSQGFNPRDNAYRKPQGISNSKDIPPGSCHSSQESLSSHLSSSSTSRLVSRSSKTDLSQPSLRSGTSSESLQSNSSTGRSDSYRVALLTEADQMSLIQEKKTAPPGSVRTTRSGSLNERSLPSNSIDRSRSSSLSSNSTLSHTAQYPSYSKHSHLSKSMSAPIAADNQNVSKNTNYKIRNSSSNEENEPVSRADSYRCAMQSSQNALLQGDIAGRNCSYRLATHDEDDDDGGVVVNLGSGNSRMDACNLWSGMSGTSRDVRRMGITDVDQLKGISADRTNGSKSSTDTQHARKKFGVRPEGGKAPGSLSDPKRMPGQGRNGSVPGVTLRDKSNKQQKLHSSSYIRFDPIFESGEDLRASKESLRPPSIVSVRTLAMTGSKETLVSDIASRVQVEGHSRTRSPTRRRSSSQGRRGSGDDDRTRNGISQSIFGSIKTTIKAIGSGGKGE